MLHETSVEKLQVRLSRSSFANDGDVWEQHYGQLFADRFRNLEKFWQQFIVPLTTRIDYEPGRPEGLHRRPGVASDLRRVGYAHYSLFLHLVYAHNNLSDILDPRKNEPAAFGDFYAHLGSVCDLVEDFLWNVCGVVRECEGGSQTRVGLKRDDVLKKTAEWFAKSYSKQYLRFVREGRSVSVPLHAITDLLDEYYTSSTVWKGYKSFAGMLRGFRNVVVHDVAMGAVVGQGGHYLVLKKEKISSYRGLDPVLDAAADAETLQRDFVVREQQMSNDLTQLLVLLNNLWETPLAHLSRLMFEGPNERLLGKYQIRYLA